MKEESKFKIFKDKIETYEIIKIEDKAMILNLKQTETLPNNIYKLKNDYYIKQELTDEEIETKMKIQVAKSLTKLPYYLNLIFKIMLLPYFLGTIFFLIWLIIWIV